MTTNTVDDAFKRNKGCPKMLPKDLQLAQVEENFTKDAEGMKKYGITLAKNHLSGYDTKYEQGPTNKSKKPWEDTGEFDELIPPLQPSIKSVDEWKIEETLFEIHEGIAYITLNRPAANNAMNGPLSQGLADACCFLKNRPDIRVAVLKANGRMFCAGGDPKAFQEAQAAAGVIASEGEEGEQGPPSGSAITGAADFHGGEANKRMAGGFARQLYELANLPQFTICCAQGSAMGGGFGMLCVCDMVLAVKQAHFVLSEVKLGVIPATISPYVIGKIGVANSKRLFCTAENCNMQKAKEMGLVQHIVDDAAEFPKYIKDISAKINQCAPGALAKAKIAMADLVSQPLNENLIRHTVKEYAKIRKGDEAESGMKALQSKKKPEWMQKAIVPKD